MSEPLSIFPPNVSTPVLNVATVASLPSATSVGVLPIYANNAAALAAGLTRGRLYITAADPHVVCQVV